MKKSILFLSISIFVPYISLAQVCFTPATFFNAGTNLSSVTTADFNGDGKMDLATANGNLNKISVLLGNGLGGFSAATNFFTVGGSYTVSVISADFNGDGKMDLATANFGTDNVSIFFGNGLGGFSAATNFTIGDGPESVISADFNGDGKIDLATANSNSNNVSILLGNGLGGFSASATFTVGAVPKFVTSADFNGDGKMDLATANYSFNNVSILLGDGLGGFSAATTFTVGINPRSVTSADFNGDGKMDLATANQGSNNVSILLGNGLGGFSAATNFTVGTLPQSVISSDFNGDGKMDLATANYSSNNISILLGNGLGGFATATNFTVGINPGAVTSADFNGDGIMDIVTAYFNPNAGISVSLGAIIINVSNSQTNVSCYGGNNGTATATVVSGTSPYSYSWNTSPIQTTGSVTNLTAGNYSVTVTDVNGCKTTESVTITQPTAISVSTIKTGITCYGGNNGTATVTISGGISPYTYSWNTSPMQNTANASNLTVGNYTVTVTDSNGCIQTANVTITQPPALTATISSIVNTKCSGVCNGYAQVTSVGNGTSPYTYQWGAAANNQTTATASSLCQGYYSVTVKDANLCSVTKNVQVNIYASANPEIYLTNLAAVDQVNVSPSFASYYTYNLPTSITPPPSNSRNFVDPGKKARFKVECTNNKSNGQSIVSGICKVRTNNPYITITDSSSALNNIGWGNYAWSADEFEINIDPNTPPGTNAYIDFIVQESGQDYSTTCIAIPITPLVYSPITPFTIDDDNNPDSQGNDNDICEQGEIIEFDPWLDNISTLDAEYVRGRFENLDNHSFITIWNGVPGINTTVYDAGWWNYVFAQPQTITSNSYDTRPEYDFVFNYGSTTLVNDFNLYMVMAGGFNLFSGSALSLVQWSLPYTFNSAVSIGDELKNKVGLSFYPNPSNDFITIENKSTLLNSTYLIFNSLGQQVLTGKLTHTTTTIDIKQLPIGFYFLQVGEDEKHTFKLMKK